MPTELRYIMDATASPTKSLTSSGSINGGSTSRSESPHRDKLDLQLLITYLDATVNEDNSIDIHNYIRVYREYDRFFDLLGTVFSFVAKDVHSKISILEELRRSQVGDHYKSINSMVEYEKNKKYVLKTGKSTTILNGSRTLLRLHRALEFIIHFLNRISTMKHDEKVSIHAQESYNHTLAKHHTWLIQKAAIIAMYSLPSRNDLIKRTCKQNVKEALLFLPAVVEKSKNVYNTTQKLYEDHHILDLP